MSTCRAAKTKQERKRRADMAHGLFIAALLATAIFKFAGACCEGKNFAQAECIINLLRNFIAFL